MNFPEGDSSQPRGPTRPALEIDRKWYWRQLYLLPRPWFMTGHTARVQIGGGDGAAGGSKGYNFFFFLHHVTWDLSSGKQENGQ